MVQDQQASEPDESVLEPVPAASGGRRPGTVIVVIGATMLAAALLGLGVFLGWRAGARGAEAPATATSVVTVPADPYGGTSTKAQMPDVRGLTRADALTALADAAIPSRVVTVVDVPWAGAEGLVVGQAPNFGTEDPTGVVLRVAAPATIPGIVGMTEAEALTTLENLGARVGVTRVFRAGAAPGTVLAVTPRPGQPAAAVVAVVTAADPGAVYLDQVTPLQGYCSTGSATVNGVDHDHVVRCESGRAGSPSVVAYSLRRGIAKVQGTIGIADDADPSSAASVTVLLDGRPQKTLRIAYGKPSPLEHATTGVLRIELRMTSLTGATVSLADVQLSGDPQIVARLGASS